jgi:hypothetical protein
MSQVAHTLESITYSHFWDRLSFDFRSIRSNYVLWGRKIETKAHSLCHLFAKLKVQLQFAVGVGHVFPRMAHPIIDEVIGHAILP